MVLTLLDSGDLPRPNGVRLIINPAAGRMRVSKARQRLRAAVEAALPGCDVLLTEGPGHARQLAAAAKAQADMVIAAGGDGTLGEVADGLAGGRAALGVLPVGTGNDFARSLGIPSDVARALAIIRQGYRHRIDLAGIGSRLFLNVAGVGFDAEVARAYHAGRKYGSPALTYVVYALKTLAAFPPVEMEFSTEDGTFRQRSLFAAVGNARYYAGGMAITPRARLDDGLLDVMIAGDMSPLEAIMALPGAFRGAHLRHPKCSYRQVVRVGIDAERPVPVMADGEVIGTTPVTVSVLPAALEVLAPPGPPYGTNAQ